MSTTQDYCKIGSIPNEIILLILNYIPLKPLLQNVSPLNRRFYSLSRLRCATRHRLTVIIGDRSLFGKTLSSCGPYLSDRSRFTAQMYNGYDKENILKFSSLMISPPSLGAKLVSTFPNVHTLRLSLDNFTSAQFDSCIIGKLLIAYQRNLESLHLVVQFKMDKQLKIIDDLNCKVAEILLSTINGMALLRRLTLSLLDLCVDRVIELPILTQLEEFYFYSEDDSFRIYDSITKFASPQLKRLGLYTYTFANDSLFKFLVSLKPNSSLGRSITHLKISMYNSDGTASAMDKPGWDRIFYQLPSLTGLTIQWSYLSPLAPLIRTLAVSSPALRHISFLFYRTYDRPYDVSNLSLATLVQEEGVTLPTVRSLCLMMQPFEHTELWDVLQLHRVMPGLESISLSGFAVKCQQCRFNTWPVSLYPVEWHIRDQLQRRCIQTFVAAFKQLFPRNPTVRLYSRNGGFVHILDQF